MRKFFVLAALVLVAFSSCQKEDVFEINSGTISAVIEQPVDTKVQLGDKTEEGYPILWSTNDEIAILPITGTSSATAVRYKTQDSGVQYAGFSKVSGDDPKTAGKYYSVFPYSSLADTYYEDGQVILDLFSTLPVSFGSLPSASFPMAASSTSLSSPLSFKPLCAVLKLSIAAKTETFYLKSVKVTTSNVVVKGKFAVDCENGTLTPYGTGSLSTSATYTAVSVPTTGRDLYIVLPAAEYNMLEIELGLTSNATPIQITSKDKITLKAGKMYSLSLTGDKALSNDNSSYLEYGSTTTTCFNTKVYNMMAALGKTKGDIKHIVFRTDVAGVPASSTVVSSIRGTCDVNAYATYDNASGTLTISTSASRYAVQSGDRLFSGMTGLKDITGLEKINFFGHSLTRIFENCSSLEAIDLSVLKQDSIDSIDQAFYGCSSLKSVILPTTCRLRSMSYAFQGCSSLTSIDLQPLGNSSVWYASGTFYGCTSLEEVCFGSVSDKQICDFSSCTGMSQLFYKCTNLKKLTYKRLSRSFSYELPIASATSIGSMFDGCASIETISLSAPSTNLTYAASVFSSCSSLKSVAMPTSGLDTPNLSSIRQMFLGCRQLTNAPFISYLNTSKVTDMENCFYACEALESLDLSNWSTASLEDGKAAGFMYGCKSIKSLTVGSKFRMPSAKGTNKFKDVGSNYFESGTQAITITGPQSFISDFKTDVGDNAGQYTYVVK